MSASHYRSPQYCRKISMADYSSVPFALLSHALGESRIRQQEREDLGCVFGCSFMLWDLDAEEKMRRRDSTSSPVLLPKARRCRRCSDFNFSKWTKASKGKRRPGDYLNTLCIRGPGAPPSPKSSTKPAPLFSLRLWSMCSPTKAKRDKDGGDSPQPSLKALPCVLTVRRFSVPMSG